MRKSTEEKNSIIAALFLFQYSLLIPLMSVIRPTLLIAGSGILLMVAMFMINRNVYMNIKAIFVIVMLVFIMLVKSLFDGTEIRVLLNFLMISIPSMVIYSYHMDMNKFLDTCHKLAPINFLLLFMMPFLVRRIEYMRFGYGMLLTVLFSYNKVFHPMETNNLGVFSGNAKREQRLNVVVFIVSLVESIIYGNRGVLLVVLSFIAIDILLIYNRNQLKNVLFILTGFIAALNLDSILSILIRITTKYGISSYAIKKYQYQLRYGLEEASSGRGKLYRAALDNIQQHPLFGDKMIVYDGSSLYVHNMFLQVGRDMGVVLMILSIVFVFYCVYLMFSKKLSVNEKTIIAVFFSVSVVRLLISSNIWERPEFWALMCIVFNYKRVLTSNPKLGESSS